MSLNSVSGARWVDVSLLIICSLLLYSVNVDFTLFGDAGMYADCVVLKKFDELTLHLGYFVVLFVTHGFMHGIFGIPIQESEVWLNAAAGALSVSVAYLLARELLGTRRDALLCAIIFGLSGRVLTNSTSSEMYMLQTLFVLSSFYSFVRSRVILSGVLSAFAMLVSPLSVFAYLFFPVYDYQRSGKIRWAVLLRLAAAGLVIYVPFLVIDGHEMLFGHRGLVTIKTIYALDPITSLRNFPIYQFKAFTVLLVLIVPAVLAARANKKLFALALAVGVPHIFVIMQLPAEDHVFILNTDFFFVCLLVIGWRELERYRIGQWVGPVLLAGHVGLYVAAGTVHLFNPHREYAEDMRRFAQTHWVGHNAVVITDWGRAVALTFYGRPRPTVPVLFDPLFQNQIFDIEAEHWPSWNTYDGREVYVLDEWAPTPLNKFLRSKSSLEAQRQQHSVVAVAERELKLRCTRMDGTSLGLYRCARRGI